MKRVLHVYVGSTDQPPGSVSDPRYGGRVAWTVHAVDKERSVDRLKAAFLIPDPTQFDAIVTSEYYCALGVNLRLRLSTSRARHLVWGLNQSRRVVDRGVLGAVANWAFARTSRIITHSRHEISLFTQMHKLPSELFHFEPWGYDVPGITPSAAFSARQTPYICLIGRNNRDLATFAQAIQRSGYPGVAVVSKLAESELTMLRQAGVEVHQNLTMNDSLDCLRHAAINAVLIKDDQRGAGHITMVSALQLGVPQVVSCAAVTADYVQMPEHGIAVPLGDARATAQAFRDLMEDAGRRARVAQAAKTAGWAHFSHASVQEAVDKHLSALL
jgi:hypothetical protein